MCAVQHHFPEEFSSIPVASLKITPEPDAEGDSNGEESSESESESGGDTEIARTRIDLQTVDDLAQQLESLAIACRARPPVRPTEKLRSAVLTASSALDILGFDLTPSDSVLPQKKIFPHVLPTTAAVEYSRPPKNAFNSEIDLLPLGKLGGTLLRHACRRPVTMARLPETSQWPWNERLVAAFGI
ncbi:hypothetical protein B0H17DRAFT_1139040 [Mycena rosella]|uniref:Uncharacterized protein n=1 Tax=Mycena rosella TaxID=1033263 RepID=A0AAD7GCZ8_MYCRO|nr:hypothetical protein B0H17DRAFT_1139040 [Mycena rosella]